MSCTLLLTIFILNSLHEIGLGEHTDTGSRSDKNQAYAICDNGDMKHRSWWMCQVGNFARRRSQRRSIREERMVGRNPTHIDKPWEGTMIEIQALLVLEHSVGGGRGSQQSGRGTISFEDVREQSIRLRPTD